MFLCLDDHMNLRSNIGRFSIPYSSVNYVIGRIAGILADPNSGYIVSDIYHSHIVDGGEKMP